MLGGVISPADGIGPEQLRMKELKILVKECFEGADSEGKPDGDNDADGEEEIEETLEVLIATNPSLEGEASASYIVDMLREIKTGNMKLVITRLAMGLPTGADLEYADRMTLKRAVEGRTEIENRK